jgi:hypothetical protein
MPIREVSRHWIVTCDCCGAEATNHSSGTRPSGWINVFVGADATDYQGNPVADASTKLILCPTCGQKIVAAMNAAAKELKR